jgi:hypothetical protein
MRNIILKILTVIMLLATNECFAKDNFPINKYNNKLSYSEINSFLKNRNRIGLHLVSYQITSFLNYNFASNVQKGIIKNDYGIDYKYRISKLSPVLFDIDYCYNHFSIDNNSSQSINPSAVIFQGIGASASIVLFPCPRYFIPYAGIGYQLSNLKGSVNESKYVSIISCPYWKTGIQSYIGNPQSEFTFSIFIEYKQSLISDKSYNQLEFGVGFYIPID